MNFYSLKKGFVKIKNSSAEITVLSSRLPKSVKTKKLSYLNKILQ